MGVWKPDSRRFPDARQLSDAIHARGYALRVWIAPAQAHPGTPIFEELWPHGFLKNRAGEPSFYVGLGTYTLDIRNERARKHVIDVTQQAARQWNLDAIKLDFPPFYRPDDDFYQHRDFDLPESTKKTMVAEFHGIVREALDGVRRGIRIESYPKCAGAIGYIDDIICGDLVACDRSWATIMGHARRMRESIDGRLIVPWLEMIWGEGADHPNASVEWHAGFLEYLAASINLELKIEHSFQPFDYPNAAQIRAVSNLYGPRNRSVKVLVAGRRTFTVDELKSAGVHLDARTRFLAASESDSLVHLHTAPLRTNAIAWRGRNVLTGEPLKLRPRNEFWDGTKSICRVEFDARAHQVYELWYEGQETDYFDNLLDEHLAPATARRLSPTAAPSDHA
jgi:hypothetical protein